MSLEGFSPNLDFVDAQVRRFTPGYKSADNPLTLFGGFGYGQVADHFKVGGYGFGGDNSVTGSFLDANKNHIRQDVAVRFGGGAFYTEYEAVHFARRFEGAVGLGIGFGGVTIQVDQFGANPTWDDLWGSLNPDSLKTRRTFSIQMSRGYFMLHPGAGVKFFITDFMALEFRAGYLLLVGLGDWMVSDVKILDAPEKDLSAPTLGLRLAFGG